MLQTQPQKTPKYRIIETDLLKMIRRGNINVGQQISTEVSISEQYKVSRLTARKALENLESKGYINRTAGKGTFVADWKTQQRGGKQESFSLRTLKNNIGLLMIDYDLSFPNPESWDMRLVRAVTYEAERFGYHITVCGASSGQMANKEIPLAIREKTICGTIVDGHITDIVIDRLIESDIPFFLAGGHRNRLNVPEISHDTEDMSYKITTALLELNHGPVWLIGPITIDYYPNIGLYKGYQKAILNSNRPDRIAQMNFCQPEDCNILVRQMINSGHKKHCIIILTAVHHRVLLKAISDNNLDINDFVFVSIGRYNKELHGDNGFMLCEIEPSKIAKETVSQIISLSEHAVSLKTKQFKLKIEKINDLKSPFKFEWV